MTDRRNPEESWRRLGLRVQLALCAARSQVVLQELALESARKPTRRGPSDEPELPYLPKVTRAQILLRSRLKDSRSARQDLDPQNECPHLELMRRGGKTLWWQCRQCVARWPRAQHEELIDG